MPSKNQIEAAALCMEHLCDHDWHGYTQGGGRWGDGEGTCPVNTPIGTCYVEQGDRDCSSAVISSYEAAGISCGGATYTGNMYDCMVGTGNFRGHWMSDGYNCDDGYVAKRGDCYLNTTSHTAMCTSAVPDLLAEFSIAEDGSIYGRTGDQTGWESVSGKAFYGFPWNWVLEVLVTDDPQPEPTPTPTPSKYPLVGIDIASWQAGITPSNTDADFVIIKVSGGAGDTAYENPYWRQWADDVLASGKLLGLYHYACEYDGEPGGRAEAENFWSKAKDYAGKFIPVLDWEAHAIDMPVSYAKAFLDRIAELSGATPWFYGYASNVNSTDYSSISKYPLWIASYLNRYDGAGWETDPEQRWGSGTWDRITAYQYTSTGRISGYGADLDLSVFYGTAEDWAKMAGSAPAGPKHENICLYDASNGTEQYWKPEWDEKHEWFRLINVKNGLALDVYGAGKKNGTKVWTYEINDESDAQWWRLEECEGKYDPKSIRPVMLVPKVNPDLALDIDGCRTDNNTKIQVWKKNHCQAQQFVIKCFDEGDYWQLINNCQPMKAVCLGDPIEPKPEPSGDPVCYRVSTDPAGRTWLDEMRDGKDTGGSSDDYAGEMGSAIRWLAVKGATYRVYSQDSGWLPWVSQYNTGDLENGCAGDGSPILGVEVKDTNVRYAVHIIGGDYYSDMIGQKDTGGSSDTYAGDLSNAIDAIRMRRA